MDPDMLSGRSHSPRADRRGPGPAPWWKAGWFFIAGTAAITLGMAWGMDLHDQVSRARDAYLQGENYYGWYRDPAVKKAALDGELASQRITRDQYTLLMKDGDLKRALVYYSSVVELFPARGNVWVEESAERIKEVEPLYEAWLKKAPQ